MTTPPPSPTPPAAASRRGLVAAVLAMMTVIAASNWLVQFALNDWLTWAAFSFPFAFLVTDLTNRRYGPRDARRVVWAGFALAVVLSAWLASPRIALASGGAFLVGQFADVHVFDRLRRARWWQAPLASSAIGSTLDTALFYSFAFVGTGLPWITWGVGDLAVKMAFALALLVPFRLLLGVVPSRPPPLASAGPTPRV